MFIALGGFAKVVFDQNTLDKFGEIWTIYKCLNEY